ncbi:MAG: tRNA (N(6)-L-threonylcarbamoyladenosine(37)-C(2))-methylthiotransferase MtaB [Lachnospiraceae bacterium]|nr:tRNA (N(6)-L-threonylcarbamoyladenosine(37)-C(2))-methylthiotransferase MtaB [Lachnospiraceae bacterium]
MKSVALHNLGCKVNAYEIENMQQKLQERGYDIVPFDSIADVYIVNTCTVTNIADRKSRQMLHRAKKLNPNAVVVAVGCYVQTGEAQVEKDACIDLAIGNNRKKDIVEILEAFLKNREQEEPADFVSEVIDINHTNEYEEMQLEKTAEHTRAYIKIQDGCNQFCSYCIIPYARGRVRSRKPEDVLQEIRGLAKRGYKEVVITGIHLSSYGMDFIGPNDGDYLEGGKDLRKTAFERAYLISLIEKIAEIDGLERIRLGSLEPRIITGEFVKRLAAIDKVCPHFHLSLQSGCDETLKRMNRHYTAGEYYEKVKLLRQGFENPAITTDVIVGFPQESEEEFEKTKAFLEKVHFFEMHIFKYSRRKGTVADRLPGQLTDAQKTVRSAQLLEMEALHSKEYRSTYLEKEVEILVEEKKEIGGEFYWIGHTKTYVKGAVLATGDITENQLVKGTAKRFLTDEVLLLDIR